MLIQFAWPAHVSTINIKPKDESYGGEESSRKKQKVMTIVDSSDESVVKPLDPLNER